MSVETAPNPQNGEDIRREMAQIRGGLGNEVEGIVDNAKTLANWRYYVKAFPWPSLAAASAVGYMLVPRRMEVVSPDAETLSKLAKKNRIVVEHRPRAQEKPNMAVAIGGLLGNVLLRAAVAYAGQHMGQFFGESAAKQDQEQVSS